VIYRAITIIYQLDGKLKRYAEILGVWHWLKENGV